MANSTDEYWDVNGTSLQTLAFNVVSIGGKYQTPKLRGGDRQYAYQHGMTHRRRWADAQTLSLGMWVQGQLEDGRVPPSRRDEFRRNMRKLVRLFTDMDGNEFALTKRWHDEDTGALMSATGHGIVPDGVKPETEGGPYRAKFVVDVLMADPFFYGPEVSVTLPLNTDVTVTVDGDASTSAVTVLFNGALSNPAVLNSAPDPDVSLKVGSAIADGDVVTVDVNQTTVTRASDTGNIIGTLSHSGARPWMILKPGPNIVRLTADSGAGNAVLKYKPVWY